MSGLCCCFRNLKGSVLRFQFSSPPFLQGSGPLELWAEQSHAHIVVPMLGKSRPVCNPYLTFSAVPLTTSPDFLSLRGIPYSM